MNMFTGKEADELRELFINSFVDTSTEKYCKNIQTRVLFSDGLCYCGYLWEYLYNCNIISYKKACDFLTARDTLLYIFWDIHTKERIWIPDYWKYPKDAVLAVSPLDLLQILPTLPEDCYFFDSSLAWAIALTHEENKPGKRICCFSARPPVSSLEAFLCSR